MRTARSLLYGGVPLTETPSGQRPPWTETPLDRYSSGIIEMPPPSPREQNHRQEWKQYIARTSFAGGKNVGLQIFVSMPVKVQSSLCIS